MRTFKYTDAYGDEYEIYFEKCNYIVDDSLAIAVWCREPGEEFWEPYGTLTVNLGPFCFGPKTAYIDTNNLKGMCEFVGEQGWARRVGEGRSGYCTYPLVEFTDEFIDEICEEAA